VSEVSLQLSKEDIEEIALAVVRAQGDATPHQCRFPRLLEVDLEDVVRVHHEVKPDELKEAIRFYKNMNQIMEQSGKTIRTLALTLGFGAIFSLLILGIWAKIRTELGL
jgi:hypothetical protein